MARFGYVRCRVSLGFFDTEFYVALNDSSAYVDRQSVRVEHLPSRNKEVEGEVLAYLVEEQQDKTLIEIPGQAVVGGLRTWVPRSFVEPIRASA